MMKTLNANSSVFMPNLSIDFNIILLNYLFKINLSKTFKIKIRNLCNNFKTTLLQFRLLMLLIFLKIFNKVLHLNHNLANNIIISNNLETKINK